MTATRMFLPPMDAAAAAWILRSVLYGDRRVDADKPDGPCACQLPDCWQCRNGHHDQCAAPTDPDPKRHATAAFAMPEAWICRPVSFGRNVGMDVVGPPVWLADRTCRYRCPCSCPPPRPAPLDLFGVAT